MVNCALASLIEEFKCAEIKVMDLFIKIICSHGYFQMKLKVIKALIYGCKVSL